MKILITTLFVLCFTFCKGQNKIDSITVINNESYMWIKGSSYLLTSHTYAAFCKGQDIKIDSITTIDHKTYLWVNNKLLSLDSLFNNLNGKYTTFIGRTVIERNGGIWSFDVPPIYPLPISDTTKVIMLISDAGIVTTMSGYVVGSNYLDENKQPLREGVEVWNFHKKQNL